MKINKNQALYRALPHAWTSYSNSKSSDYKYACEVKYWNTAPVQGINEEVIRRDIERRAKSFENAGGVVTDEFSEEKIASFTFVEPLMNEGIPDIICVINPTTFYCPKCGTVEYKQNSNSRPKCKCGVRMNQLQMVYPCECGYCDGVKPAGKNLFYHSKDQDNQFKFFTNKGQKREMTLKCPICSNILMPKNASDSRITYSHSGNIVNLYSEKYSNALKKYKFDAEILMLAKWFGIVSHNDYLSFVEDHMEFFERKLHLETDADVIKMAGLLKKTPSEVASIMNAVESDKTSIDSVKSKISDILPLSLYDHRKDELSLITFDLMEFDTLKNPQSVITLDAALGKALQLEKLFDKGEIYELADKLHIKNMQVSEAVQIVNYAYGYTRMRSCPDGTENTKNLRLRSFENGKVFTSILNTEGILFEMDMIKIYKWLCDNSIISGDEIVDDELKAKKWFIENINLESISHFNTIPGGVNIVTKVVYSLIHTISHMMIISAGRHSGLSRDSISEIIFPNTCAFFIYPTSSEGVTLGSISGMFESDLKIFLEDALSDNEICTFDPVCKTNQNGACVACSYLSEVNCTHFNKDLSRSYLYGGEININNEKIVIEKGFWK